MPKQPQTAALLSLTINTIRSPHLSPSRPLPKQPQSPTPMLTQIIVHPLPPPAAPTVPSKNSIHQHICHPSNLTSHATANTTVMPAVMPLRTSTQSPTSPAPTKPAPIRPYQQTSTKSQNQQHLSTENTSQTIIPLGQLLSHPLRCYN
ncbi:hypothetical protein [Bartonella sp. CR127HXZ]|uniref:hypothetical protein n=1 Tax=Bartonella sp. CR127HXZ TaxID=1460985 RepID=UPI0035CF1AE9